MTTVIYPKRLAPIAGSIGASDDRFLEILGDQDHDDVFVGDGDLLSKHIDPNGCTVITSMLDPNRFGFWIASNSAIARTCLWDVVIARQHSRFMDHACLGAIRYLQEIGAKVQCFLPATDARMRDYYLNGAPQFSKHGIAIDTIEKSQVPKSTLLTSRIFVSRSNDQSPLVYGINRVEGTIAEVTPWPGHDTWMGMPCSIAKDMLASIALLVNWFEPDSLVDAKTNGYGSTAFLANISAHFNPTIIPIEEEQLLTRTFESKLLDSRLARGMVSIRCPVDFDLSQILRDTMRENESKLMVVAQENDRVTQVIGDYILSFDEILLVSRVTRAPLQGIIKAWNADGRYDVEKILLNNDTEAFILKDRKH